MVPTRSGQFAVAGMRSILWWSLTDPDHRTHAPKMMLEDMAVKQPVARIVGNKRDLCGLVQV